MDNKKTLNDLPIDIWIMIIKKLPVIDLLNCRLVNKKFKYFSDNHSCIDQLLIGDFHYDFLSGYKEKIEEQDIINIKVYQIIESLSIFNLNKNLKYLLINDSQLKLKISHLTNLEYLVIQNIAIGCNQFIDLKNLKTLIIKHPVFKLNLNTPKLEKISISKINNNSFEFQSSPESIKHLLVDEYDDKFRVFKNLEIFEIEYIGVNLDLNLLSFDKLKILKINDFFGDAIKPNLVSLFERNVELEKQVDIYFKGVKITSKDKINEYNLKNELEYQIRNYDYLDFNLRCSKLNYDEFELLFNNLKIDLPFTFFEKYSNISEVLVVGSIKNACNLNWFLDNLKRLDSLYLHETRLDRFFFNNLPNTIKQLYIQTNYAVDIDYNFIFKLIRLNKFVTNDDQDLFELAYSAFEKLKYLNYFQFRFSLNLVRVIKQFGKLSIENYLVTEYSHITSTTFGSGNLIANYRLEIE